VKTKHLTFTGRFSLAGLSACLSGALLLSVAPPAGAVEKQVIKGYGYVHQAIAGMAPNAAVPTTGRLHLSIGLPLRDADGLNRAIKELHDPASPRYQQWMTPQEVAAKFCATEQDYQAVVAWAQRKNLTVTATYGNHICIEVDGSVADIQNAFNVTLHTYPHPTEARMFYAPNTDPSIDCAVPVLTVDGLDNFDLPKPNFRVKQSFPDDGSKELGPPAGGPITPNDGGPITPNGGSAPGGAYAGCDFRAAYFPGTTLHGTGQNVGLLQYDDFFDVDISNYESQFGLQFLSPIRVVVNGPMPPPGGGQGEVCLDIEMVLAMAPGVQNIYVYEAPNTIANWVPLLSRIQTDNLCPQVSCSWSGGADNASGENVFLAMAAQGQSFFNATGDQDAFLGFISFPSMSPYITECGGTTLSTSGPCGSRTSEVVWNWGGGTGSSGGWTNVWGIPWWQAPVNMTANLGSTVYRNVPDVALTGDNVYVRYNNGGAGVFGGTSVAAPLWAGVTALVNEKAAYYYRGGQGFLNPAIYAGALNTNQAYFHDITVGNNQKPGSGALYSAQPGYDLCTGWGTPAGQGIIDYLAGTAGGVPNGGFEIGDLSQWHQSGPGLGVTGGSWAHSGTHGAFFAGVGSLGYIWQEIPTVPGQNYVLSFWVRNFGGPANEFYVYCNSTLLDLVNVGPFGWTQYQFIISATYFETFLEFGGRQDPSSFALDDVTLTPLPGSPEMSGGLPLNGGFETGTLAYWPNGGGAGVISFPPNVHSGNYAVELGPVGVTNAMSQVIPTVPGQTYRLAFWLANTDAGAVNDEFSVWWNGTKLTELANFGTFGYQEYDFTVAATSASTVLQFTYRNDPSFIYLDDITVTPLLGPALGQGAYVRSTIGEPWGVINNRNAMDSVFGAGNWNDARFETVDPALLFSPTVHFVFMDGSDSGANALSTFLANNLTRIQNWVANGGSLYLNAAPNVGGNINFGFGVTLNYGAFFSGDGTAANPANPVFKGPFQPVDTYYTGGWFSHASVSGAGLVPIIISTNLGGAITLGEMNYGSGHVMFGGLTTDNFHSPSPQAQNLTANILEYGNLNPMGMFDDLANFAAVPNGYRGVNWNNFVALNGLTYVGNPSGYQAGVISRNNVAFNNFANPASISSPTPFNLFSGWATAAWNDNLTLEVKGYVNGLLTYDQTYTLSATTPQFITFNMINVTEVDFSSSGGTSHGYGGGGTHFAIDDLTITTAPAQAAGVDHYVFSGIPAAQCMNAAFPVTITARDQFNATATVFNTPVSLSGWAGTGNLIEGFESGVWPQAPWVITIAGTPGTIGGAYAHNGAFGLSDPEWDYRTDVSIGNGGDTLSWWVRPGSGRAYLGFATVASSTWAIVACPNTGTLNLQHDTGATFGTFNEILNVPQAWTVGHWYRVAVYFNSPTSVTCNLYDSDGTTLLNTISYDQITGAPGGIAMRAFGTFSLDTIRGGPMSPVAISPNITGNFLNGVWTGNVEVYQPETEMVLMANDGFFGPGGTSNPFHVDNDPPVLGAVTRIAGGVSLTWSTCPGGRYQVQYTTSLFPPPVAWTNLGSPITAGGTSLTVNDLFSGPYRFYRIILLP
jgi:hypothetical protein